jgi:hypothetical protein
LFSPKSGGTFHTTFHSHINPTSSRRPVNAPPLTQAGGPVVDHRADMADRGAMRVMRPVSQLAAAGTDRIHKQGYRTLAY